MKNVLTALFAGCLGISLVAVGTVVTGRDTPVPPKKAKIVRTHDKGSDIIDAAIARQLAAAKARVAAVQGEHIAIARK